MIKQKELKYHRKIYYGDTDAGGVVYHADYIRLFEEARTEFMHSFGFKLRDLEKQNNLIFIVSNLSIKYLKPIYLEDEIIIFTKIKELRKVSVTFSQYIKLNNKDDVVCNFEVKLGCIDLTAMKPNPIPDFITKHWR